VNRRMLTLLAGGAAAAFALAMPLSAAPPGTNHNNSDASADEDCGNGNALTIVAPEQLWPPNHKYYTDIHVTADDAQGGNVTLETTGTHDQYDGDTGTETNGSGNTADDITTNGEDPTLTTSPDNGQTIVHSESGPDVVTTDWQARAERSGRIKDGRSYSLSALATFSDGTECTHSVSFSVPHDMRRSTRS
jgi:hypothetical protein